MLERARLIASSQRNLPGTIHALHLPGCLCYSERNYTKCRALHNEVLDKSRQLGHQGGMGSSLYDLVQVDLAESDLRVH